MSLTYAPQIFDVPTELLAKSIILTPGFGQTTDERWEKETPYITELIGQSLQIAPDMLVVDFGCGIGRVAKALIEAYGCRVIGVDISRNMRILGQFHFESDRFITVSPDAFSALVQNGLRVDAAFSVWCLQHCVRPENEIGLIHAGLRDGGQFCVINNTMRAIPTHEEGWFNDGLDIYALLGQKFTLEQSGKLDPAIITQEASDLSYIATLRK